MGEKADPRVVRASQRSDGLEIARQAGPPGASSFAATCVVPGGWAYDPAGGEGTALITSLVAASAAGRRNRVELARMLDRHGATLTRRVAPETAEFSVWGPRASFAPLLDLLADVVLRPRFDPSDVARVRRQTLERQLREGSQPAGRAEKELLAALFPRGHPYSATGLGSHRSVVAVSRRDLVRFHREHASAEGSLVVVTGALSTTEVERAVHRSFGSFPTSRAPNAPTAPPARRGRERPVTVRMPGRSQVEIRVGAAAPPRSDPGYASAFLANEVLGGSVLSRLFQRVRERSGLAYHASSELEAMRWGGFWVAEAGTGPERLRSALRDVTAEVDRLRTELIPSTELGRIRRSVIGEIPLAFETTQGAHEIGVDVAYHHLGPTFVEQWPGLLNALTAADLRRAAAESLAPERRVTVLAGPIGA